MFPHPLQPLPSSPSTPVVVIFCLSHQSYLLCQWRANYFVWCSNTDFTSAAHKLVLLVQLEVSSLLDTFDDGKYEQLACCNLEPRCNCSNAFRMRNIIQLPLLLQLIVLTLILSWYVSKINYHFLEMTKVLWDSGNKDTKLYHYSSAIRRYT